jgi:hydrogenase nickel incorporation protein HypA/HybF
VEEVPARVRCRTCSTEALLDDNIPLCRCGSADVQVLSGAQDSRSGGRLTCGQRADAAGRHPRK